MSHAVQASGSLVFSHANSFPASTYERLFAPLRARGFSVQAIECLGHDPRFPVTNNWPHIVQQLQEFTQVQVAQVGAPVWLVGHSLGGFLSLMVAARNPSLVCGVVLIDAPILGGWRSKAVDVMKRTAVFGALSPGAVSRRRRNSWSDVEAAFVHFRDKKAFARWDAGVLRDYVQHATVEHDGRRVLRFDREVETQFYNTVPDNLERMLARHPVRCPVSYIGGLASREMRQVGMALTHRITKGRVTMLDGSHLFPMEKPLACAAAIEAALRNMGARPGSSQN